MDLGKEGEISKSSNQVMGRTAYTRVTESVGRGQI